MTSRQSLARVVTMLQHLVDNKRLLDSLRMWEEPEYFLSTAAVAAQIHSELLISN